MIKNHQELMLALMQTLQAYGLKVNESQLQHGKLIRCKTDDDKRASDKSGFVIPFFNDTFIHVLYGDHRKGGDIFTWSSKTRYSKIEKLQIQKGKLQSLD